MSLGQYIRQFALLIRFPNSFTVVANVLAATAVAGGFDDAISPLFWLMFASLCLYHGGIILNDCLDIEEDRKTQPDRPLVKGFLPYAYAWGLGWFLLFMGILVLSFFDRQTMMVGMGLLGAILAYNFSPREGLVGCAFMGLCRSLNWLVVLSAFGAAEQAWPYAALVGVYVMSLTFLSRDENYAQRKWLVGLCMASLLLGTVGFLLQFEGRGIHYIASVTVIVAGLSVLFYRLFQLYRHYSPRNIRAIVMIMILGMIPLDATLVFVAGAPVTALLILLLIIPSRYAARYLYVT